MRVTVSVSLANSKIAWAASDAPLTPVPDPENVIVVANAGAELTAIAAKPNNPIFPKIFTVVLPRVSATIRDPAVHEPESNSHANAGSDCIQMCLRLRTGVEVRGKM
jgi:hypothetical protein